MEPLPNLELYVEGGLTFDQLQEAVDLRSRLQEAHRDLQYDRFNEEICWLLEDDKLHVVLQGFWLAIKTVRVRQAAAKSRLELYNSKRAASEHYAKYQGEYYMTAAAEDKRKTPKERRRY